MYPLNFNYKTPNFILKLQKTSTVKIKKKNLSKFKKFKNTVKTKTILIPNKTKICI